MVDVLTPEQRQLNMRRIRGRDTKPEMLVRRGLHAFGLRFRLQVRDLPGRPDLVFPRYRAVILIHGCFWHGHDCPMFRMPGTRTEFWAAKIAANRTRDATAHAALLELGWRVATVWECCLKGPARWPLELVLGKCADFIRASDLQLTIEGEWPVAFSDLDGEKQSVQKKQPH